MPRRTLAGLFLAAASLANAAEVKTGFAARTVTVYTVKSESLGTDRKVNVLLPVDYETSTARYPVLYLLHGYSDDHTAWALMTNLTGYAARHKVIIVMPDGGLSFYVNAAGDPKAKFEDFIVKDLVAFADSNLRTIPLPRARAIAGLSMGGYGAAFLGLKHRNRYSALGSFSGALSYARMPAPPNTGAALTEQMKRRAEEMMNVMGPADSPSRTERDPFALIEKLDAATAPLIYIACGGQDFLIEGNRDFVKALAARKIPYEYREVSPRGHTWDFWDDQVRVFLDLLDTKAGWKAD